MSTFSGHTIWHHPGAITNRRMKTKTVNDHHLDTFPMSVTGLSAVTLGRCLICSIITDLNGQVCLLKASRFYMNIWINVRPVLFHNLAFYLFSKNRKNHVRLKLELFIYELPALITWITDSLNRLLFFVRHIHLFNKIEQKSLIKSNESRNYFSVSFFFLTSPWHKWL